MDFSYIKYLSFCHETRPRSGTHPQCIVLLHCQLLGHFNDGLWKDGLLQKILGDAHFMNDAVKTYLTNYKKQEQSKQKHKSELPSVLLKWVVMDGVLHPNWTEGLNTVVDQERKLSLANGGQIPVNSKLLLCFKFRRAEKHSLSSNNPDFFRP